MSVLTIKEMGLIKGVVNAKLVAIRKQAKENGELPIYEGSLLIQSNLIDTIEHLLNGGEIKDA